ncbi:MAG: hypothetical protein HY928_08245 [Elusimicrobia bacterium]|nr:hypothetical protein [Elusimicrobiota bacterium]
MKAALAAALAAAALNLSLCPPPLLAPGAAVSLAGDGVVTNAAFWSLGMRRLAADLAFIRLLVYYGTHEDDEEGGHHGYDGPDRKHDGYPEVMPRVRRIMAMDPFWSHPVMYGVGALAFNLERPDEALALLEEALARRPGDAQLISLVAAVGFHRGGDLAQAVDRMMPAIDLPGTPTMLRNMAAYMNERLGRRETALRLYREILQSRDSNYHDSARRGIQRVSVF